MYFDLQRAIDFAAGIQTQDVVFTIILCILIQFIIVRIRANSAYPVFDVGRTANSLVRLCPQEVILAVCIVVLLLDFAQATAWEYSILTSAVLLLVLQRLPSVKLREHGIETGCEFIPWHRISGFSWKKLRNDGQRLRLKGAWIRPRTIDFPGDRAETAKGLVSGAARLEQTSRKQLCYEAIFRATVWSAVAVLIYFILVSLKG